LATVDWLPFVVTPTESHPRWRKSIFVSKRSLV
jgi:hypothetical protein